jgi:hypothetical protein
VSTNFFQRIISHQPIFHHLFPLSVGHQTVSANILHTNLLSTRLFPQIFCPQAVISNNCFQQLLSTTLFFTKRFTPTLCPPTVCPLTSFYQPLSTNLLFATCCPTRFCPPTVFRRSITNASRQQFSTNLWSPTLCLLTFLTNLSHRPISTNHLSTKLFLQTLGHQAFSTNPVYTQIFHKPFSHQPCVHQPFGHHPSIHQT